MSVKHNIIKAFRSIKCNDNNEDERHVVDITWFDAPRAYIVQIKSLPTVNGDNDAVLEFRFKTKSQQQHDLSKAWYYHVCEYICEHQNVNIFRSFGETTVIQPLDRTVPGEDIDMLERLTTHLKRFDTTVPPSVLALAVRKVERVRHDIKGSDYWNKELRSTPQE